LNLFGNVTARERLEDRDARKGSCVYSFELSETEKKTGLWLPVVDRKFLLLLQKLMLAFKVHYNRVLCCLSKTVLRIDTYMDLCKSMFQ
jgi:hypothetical protein